MKWLILPLTIIVFWVETFKSSGQQPPPAPPAVASTCSPADRAIIEKEWLTKKGDEPLCHNSDALDPAKTWWHSCSSIEKIELIDTTDKGRMYKVMWIGEITTRLMPFPASSILYKMYIKDGHIEMIQSVW